MALRSVPVDYDIVGQEHQLADDLNNQQFTPEDLNTSMGEHFMGRRYGQMYVYVDPTDINIRVYYDENDEKWINYDHVEEYCYV